MKVADELIDHFVSESNLPDDNQLRAMLREVGRPGFRIEHNQLDLKREFLGTDTSWLDLIRDTVAMSNSGGGVLVIGIADDGARIGLKSSLSNTLDSTKIANRLQRYTSAAQVLRTGYREIESYRKLYGFLWVYPGGKLLVFDKTIQYSNSNKVALHQAVLYVRRKTATEPATQHELNEAVQRIATKNLKAFIARIDHVASLPASTELIATAPRTTKGYHLTASGEGIPVTIVGPKYGASAVRIDETLLPDLPLTSPTHEIANQVRQWHTDPSHRVLPSALHRWYLTRSELDLDAVNGSAEFALMCAVDRGDFPMYWASQLQRSSLREILDSRIKSNSHPASLIVPYIVGAFFWDQRKSMLPDGYGTGKVAQRVIECPSIREFVTSVRRTGQIIRFDGREMRMSEALANREVAREVYESILQAGDHVIQENRPALHQIDLFIHVPVA